MIWKYRVTVRLPKKLLLFLFTWLSNFGKLAELQNKSQQKFVADSRDHPAVYFDGNYSESRPPPPFRTFDGTCNNYGRPLQGASLTAFRRLLPPQYENGFNTPVGWDATRLYNGLPKPSARHISNTLIASAKVPTIQGFVRQNEEVCKGSMLFQVLQHFYGGRPSTPIERGTSLKGRCYDGSRWIVEPIDSKIETSPFHWGSTPITELYNLNGQQPLKDVPLQIFHISYK